MQTVVPASTVERGQVSTSAQQASGTFSAGVGFAFFNAGRLIGESEWCKFGFKVVVDFNDLFI